MSKFIDDIKKVKESRIHKAKNSYGVYDAYKDIRKNKWFNIGRPLSEKEFYLIIRNVNNEIANLLSIGNSVKLPYRMGRLEVRKRKKIIKFVDNKIKTNAPIDWNETLKLWEQDEYCFKKRKLIRNIDDDIFLIKWDKKNVIFNNNTFFRFRTNRFLKNLMKNNIKNNILSDAFLLNDYYSKY